MLRFVDGWDVVEHDQAKLKYNGYLASLDQNSIITPGRDGFGRAFCLVNNAFGFAQYQLIMGPQATWGFHADVQISKLGTSSGFGQVVDWWEIQRPDGLTTAVALSIRLLATGQLQLIGAGGSHTTTVAPLLIDTYYTIELKAVFGSTVELRVNGVNVAHGTLGMPATVPDRLGFRWQAFGPPSLIIDNLVIWDGQAGDTFDDFTGRVRVTTLLPNSDAVVSWAPSSGAHAYAMVNDNVGRIGGSPDGDFTYIRQGGADQLMGVAAADCYGRVLALAANVCGRVTSGTGSVEPIVQLSGTTVWPLGPIAQTASYATKQALAVMNPATDDTWVDADINGGWWGVRSAASLERVTAFYLEKVVDLTGLPYTCGGASNYSFQR